MRGTLTEDGRSREQSVGRERGVRAVRIEGKRPKTLVDVCGTHTIVVFHPGERVALVGSGVERRRLLDRIALYLAPGVLDELGSYTRASRERQRALEERGASAKDLDDWESLMVTHGVAVRRARQRASSEIAEAASRAFAKMAPAHAGFDLA